MEDSVARFVAEMCRVGQDLRIRRSEIYSAYLQWCAVEGVPECNTWTFCRTLREIGFTDIRISATGGTGFGWKGLALWDTPASWAEEMRRFFSECCSIRDFEKIDRADLYAAYVAWCEAQGLEPRNQRELGTELRHTYPEIRKTTFSRGTGIIYPGWYGIGLRAKSRSLKL